MSVEETVEEVVETKEETEEITPEFETEYRVITNIQLNEIMKNIDRTDLPHQTVKTMLGMVNQIWKMGVEIKKDPKTPTNND
jgi:chemotaxis regulatin CheY-phosphate phosphatase CheZ